MSFWKKQNKTKPKNTNVKYISINVYIVEQCVLLHVATISKKRWNVKYVYTECIHTYGENSRYQCSAHCINQTCDWFNGRCVFGCKVGRTCNRVKLIPKTYTDEFNSFIV